ncbi:MAG: hypothetical protein IPK13_01605 [Deltaproteobacteria bacterium]|nr:hypothetical protein [Deltaproteobacteria bacterium]
MRSSSSVSLRSSGVHFSRSSLLLIHLLSCASLSNSLLGCSDDDDSNNPGGTLTGADAGAGDASAGDASAGDADASLTDAAIADVGREGAPCVFNAATQTHDCGGDLDCIPWNLEAALDGNAAAVSSCVRVCDSSDDCEAPYTSCVDTWLWSASSSQIYTVSHCALNASGEIGDSCSGSRRLGEFKGCGAGLSCHVGFGDSDPDQGTCTQVCERALDASQGDCPAAAPYCNPYFAASEDRVAGLCATRATGVGGACSVSDPTRDCDQARPDVLCLGGIDRCVELCVRTGTTTSSCEATNGLGFDAPATCSFVAKTETSSVGVCSVGCDEVPDPCPDTVGNASCAIISFSQTATAAACLEVTEPFLPAEWLYFAASDQGASVQPDHRRCATSLLDCAAGSRCIQLGAAESACLTPCDPDAPVTGCERYGDAEVECFGPIDGVVGFDEPVGLCGKSL